MRATCVPAGTAVSVTFAAALVLTGVAAAAPPVAAVSPTAWSLERAYAGRVGAVSLAIDGEGHVHIAAAARAGLVYVTDRSGDWVGKVVLHNVDDGSYETWGMPSIALDEAGHVFIAVAYGDFEAAPASSDGIWSITDKGRAPGTFGGRQKLAGAGATAPSLKVHDGHLYLAYGTMGDDGPGHLPVWFKTDATGPWTRVRVARDGADPSLRVDSAGRARIAYAGTHDIRYARASTPSGGFTVSVVPGSTGRSWGEPSLALDTAERPHIAWIGGAATLYARQTPTGWSTVSRVGPWVPRMSLSVDAQDVPHVAMGGSDIRHAWRAGGTWHRETIAIGAEPYGGGVAVRATPMGLFIAFGRTTDARGVWVARS